MAKKESVVDLAKRLDSVQCFGTFEYSHVTQSGELKVVESISFEARGQLIGNVTAACVRAIESSRQRSVDLFPKSTGLKSPPEVHG